MSYLHAVEMGAVAGMRSMAAPAMVSDRLSRADGHAPEEGIIGFLADPAVAKGLKALAAGEMLADKTPWIPDRTASISLVGRGMAGALVGAALCARRDGCRPEVGALLGMASALAATYAAFHLRRALARELHVPDPVLGAVEDALVVAAGRRTLDSMEAQTGHPAPTGA
jgi:uncharacterized membrane protein